MRLTIRIDFDETRHIGHGKIRLIESVAQTGSISGAARAMNMSYRRAWLLVDEVNRMFQTPVIETQLGGKGGGHARLTASGEKLVALYRTMETRAQKDWAKEIAEFEALLAPQT